MVRRSDSSWVLLNFYFICYRIRLVAGCDPAKQKNGLEKWTREPFAQSIASPFIDFHKQFPANFMRVRFRCASPLSLSPNKNNV